MNKLFYYSGLTSLVLWIGIILAVLFLSFYPFKVVRVESPYPVLNKIVSRGTEVNFVVKYTKYLSIRASSNWFIVCEDGNLVTLAPTSTNFPLGENTIIRSIAVPEKTSLGVCQLKQTIQFFVNPLQTQTFNFESEPFTVIE